MLFSSLDSNKLLPHFIHDGGYDGYGDPDRFIRTYNEPQTGKNDENLVLEYLKLIKTMNKKTQEIQDLEIKRRELSNKIISNPALKESLEKLLNENVKTK